MGYNKTNQPQKSTIEDVAQRVQLSTATVSRALNKPEIVSEKTRKRIHKAAAELRYVQNTAAQNLRLSRTNTIIIFLPDLGNAFFSAIIRGIEREASKENYNILIIPTQSEIPADDVYRKYTNHNLTDGIITLTGELPISSEYFSDDFSLDGLPPIVMACELLTDKLHPDEIMRFKNKISTISINNVESARIATKHLLDMGHKNIVHVTGPRHNILTIDRMAGFSKALKNAGIKHPQDYIVYGDEFSPHSGEKVFTTIHQHPMNPTAVFCASDDIAMGFMTACRRQGLSIPDDYSVMGFDDVRFAQHLFPPLSTIHQPREYIGIIAMRILIKHLKNSNSDLQNIVLDADLVKRESVARVTQ